MAMAIPQLAADKGQLHFNVEISPDVDKLLGELADKTGGSKGDVLLKGLFLMKIALQAQDEGKKIGIAEKDQPLATEIIGLSSIGVG